MLLLFFKGLNLGIDFKGGTLIEVSTNNSSIGELRDILSPNFNEVSLQEFGDDQTIIIRLQNENNQESIETVNKVSKVKNEEISLEGQVLDALHTISRATKMADVKKGASIGANATIVCGNNIGEYAFVGAGAVVTKEIKPYALVVGNPSQQIGWVSEYGHRLEFNEAGFATCKESKQQYQLRNDFVKKME